jgi:hypothetical protein
MSGSKVFYDFAITSEKRVKVVENQFGSKEIVFQSHGHADFSISKTVFLKLRNLTEFIDDGWKAIAAGNKPPQPLLQIHAINKTSGGRNVWILRFLKIKRYVDMNTTPRLYIFTHL